MPKPKRVHKAHTLPVAPEVPAPESVPVADAGLDVWKEDRVKPPIEVPDPGTNPLSGAFIPAEVETVDRPFIVLPTEDVPVVATTPLEDRVPHGTIIERTERGWKVSLMYGGALRLFGEGPTIRDAFAAVHL